MASTASAVQLSAPVHPQRISISSILERAWMTVRQNPLLTISLSMLLGAAPVVAWNYFLQLIRPVLIFTIGGYLLPNAIALFFAQFFISLIVGVVMQGAIVIPVLATDQGSRPGYGACFASVLRNLWPLMMLGVLTAVAVEIGSTLLIVPGVVVYLLWSVAPSALVAEGDGIFLALDRSQELVKGARLKVFALLFLLEIANAVIGIVGLLVVGRVFGFSARILESPGYAVTLFLINIVSCLMWAAVQGSLYVELRQWKEGGSVDTLQRVFA